MCLKWGEVMTKKKVKLAIIDIDLKARTIGHYPVSDDGTQIRVTSGGESHFMPRFDNDSFIEFPKKFLGIHTGWDRIYIAKKGAKSCVNFKTGDASSLNLEQLKKSVGATLLNKMGDKKEAFPAWIIYLILVTSIGIALKVFGVIA